MSGESGGFVVLTTQRTGSTWLLDLLSGVPGVTGYGELLLRQPRRWDIGKLDVPRFWESPFREMNCRPLALRGYLRDLYSRPGCVGFKLMYSQVRQVPEVIFLLRAMQIKVIHLRRRNLLDQWISREVKRLTGRSHRVEGTGDVGRHGIAGEGPACSPESFQISPDPGRVVAELRRLARQAQLADWWLRFSRQPRIELYYEDLRDSAAEFTRVVEFLGLKPPPEIPSSEVHRMTSRRREELLANYSDVAAALRHNGLNAYLD